MNNQNNTQESLDKKMKAVKLLRHESEIFIEKYKAFVKEFDRDENQTFFITHEDFCIEIYKDR